MDPFFHRKGSAGPLCPRSATQERADIRRKRLEASWRANSWKELGRKVKVDVILAVPWWPSQSDPLAWKFVRISSAEYAVASPVSHAQNFLSAIKKKKKKKGRKKEIEGKQERIMYTESESVATGSLKRDKPAQKRPIAWGCLWLKLPRLIMYTWNDKRRDTERRSSQGGTHLVLEEAIGEVVAVALALHKSHYFQYIGTAPPGLTAPGSPPPTGTAPCSVSGLPLRRPVSSSRLSQRGLGSAV